jgi:hypothetical protein
MPKKEIEIEWNGKKYTVKFPNNGQYQKIQSIKSQLLPDSFNMEFAGAESQFAVTLAEAQAHMTVMCPTLIKDLPKSFSELELIEAVEILDIYVKEIRVWYNEWLEIIFKVVRKDEQQPV